MSEGHFVVVLTWILVQFGVNKHKENFSKTTKLYELIRCVQFVVFEKFKRDDKKVKTEEMLTAHALLCICIKGLGIMSGEQNQTAMKWKSYLLVPSMISDKIGWHNVLWPANQNYDKIREANQILVIHLHNTIWSYLWNAPYYPVALSNYKHDMYTAILVLKLGWWWRIMFKNFVVVLIKAETVLCRWNCL